MTNLDGLRAKLQNAHARIDSIVSAFLPLSGGELSGPVLFDGVSNPGTPASGKMYLYANTVGRMAMEDSGGITYGVKAARGNIQSFTSNSGTETGVSAAWQIPANSMGVGTFCKLTVYGVGTYSSGTVTWIQNHVFGGGQARAAYASLPGTFMWWGETTIICVTTGSTGTALVTTRFTVSAADVQANPSLILGFTGGVSGTTVTVDTTSATTMQMTSAGNGTFSLTGVFSTFERS